jgi:Ca-activated chloride channel family protein
VFVLGLGDSMNGRDVRPSRIARARHKVLDAVDRASAGSVALVVYREEAFAVSPMTDDANVLREVIPLLETKLMPGRAVRPARGIDEAMRLLEPVGARGARIVLVTDGADDDPDATDAAVGAAVDAGARVSVLGVAGVSDALAALASSGGGASAALAIDDGDIDRVLAGPDAADPLSGAVLSKSDIRADEWKDMGAWLLWIPLALAPFAFRHGWAAAVVALLFFQLTPAPASAAELDLFQRPDQKGASAFADGRFAESAEHFEDPAWQAAARYRAGDFPGAAEALAAQTDSASLYNLGNALAKAGQLQEAVAAYDRALETGPDDEDARFNRDLVKKLLEEQPPQQSPDDQSGDQGEKSDQQQDSADSKGDSKQDGDTDPEDSSASEGSQSEDQKDAQAGEQDESKSPGQAEQENGEAGEQRDEASAGEKQDEQPDGAEVDQQQAAAQDPSEGDAGDERMEPIDPSGEPREGDQPGVQSASPSAEEQQRAQWMARLPDDPGGLLRERIRRDYLRKRAERHGGGGQ